MSNFGTSWTWVGGACVRALPPRSVEQSVIGDAGLMFILPVAEAGMVRWNLLWAANAGDAPTYDSFEEAVEAGDRIADDLVAKASRGLAAQVGLDPERWGVSRDSLGGRPTFFSRRFEHLTDQRDLAGVEDAVDRQVAATRGWARHASPSVSRPDADEPSTPARAGSVAMMITEVQHMDDKERASSRYEDRGETYFAVLCATRPYDAVHHRVPLHEEAAMDLQVGEDVLVELGAREGDGFRPVVSIECEPEPPAPRPR